MECKAYCTKFKPPVVDNYILRKRIKLQLKGFIP